MSEGTFSDFAALLPTHLLHSVNEPKWYPYVTPLYCIKRGFIRSTLLIHFYPYTLDASLCRLGVLGLWRMNHITELSEFI